MLVFSSNSYFASAIMSMCGIAALPTGALAREYPLGEYAIVVSTAFAAVEHGMSHPPQVTDSSTLSCYLRDSSGYFWRDTLRTNYRNRIINGQQATLEGNVLKWSVPGHGANGSLYFSYDMESRIYQGTDNRGNILFKGECENSPLFDK